MAQKAVKKKRSVAKKKSEHEDFDLPIVEEKQYVEVSAPIFDKTIALIIDLALLLIIVSTTAGIYLQRILPVQVSMDQLERMMSISSELRLQMFIFALFMSFVCFVYFIGFEWRKQATIGKAIMKLKVVSTRSGSLSWWQLFVRNLALVLPISMTFILPAVILADAISQIFNKERMRWLERISQSKVVKRVAV